MSGIAFVASISFAFLKEPHAVMQEKVNDDITLLNSTQNSTELTHKGEKTWEPLSPDTAYSDSRSSNSSSPANDSDDCSL